MLKNYFKTAWRNLIKNKAFSLINISGLAIGITVCIMIFLFVMNEFSVDNFHENRANIYRVHRGIVNEGKNREVGWLSGPYLPALLNDFKGQVSAGVRVNPSDDLVTIGERSFHELKVYNTDDNFFTFFNFPLLRGNASDVLKKPNSVVLTENTARRYFGSADAAMGKVITLDKDLQVMVTGVAQNVPVNSTLEFDLVVPLANYPNVGIMTRWINNGLYTFLALKPGVTQASLENQFPAFMEKYMGSDMRKLGYHFTLGLDHLSEIYFKSELLDNVRHGDKSVVFIFLSIAGLILLIACINFMNLSTIRAAERSKEVGLRKVLGAVRGSLIWQFIGESVLITTISCLFSVMLLMLLLGWYNELLGYSLTVSWNTPPIYLFLGGVILVAGLLSGSYPAFFLSGFTPIQALKGKLKMGRGGSNFRQALVIIQFSISVFLVVGVIVIAKQMSFVRNKQLGYNSEQTVAVAIDNNDFFNNMNRFKKNLEANPAVSAVSAMSGEPGGFFDTQMFEVEGQAEPWASSTEYADFEMVNTLGLKIIAGRKLSSSFPTDTTDAVLVNKTAADRLGFTPEQAVGKWIRNTLRDSLRRRIVGVVADFNFQSLKQNLTPLVISPGPDRRMMLVKLAPGDVKTGVELIQKEYAAAAPGFPFEYKFLDQQFDRLYQKDIRQQKILTVFAILAIFVAGLGLFGLASFTATKRFKEIGVRKVLGSSVQSIVLLLSKDLLKPVLIATCIALPAGYLIMNKWLQNFHYKTSLSWWVFVLAALLTFLIAFATVSMKAVKAALANPVKSLRAD